MTDVALAVDGHVDRPLEVRLHLGEGQLDADVRLEGVDAVDAEAEALDAADGHPRGARIVAVVLEADGRPALLLDLFDEPAAVVDLVAEVEVHPERDASFGLAEVGAGEAAEQGAGAAAGDAHAARAVEQEELDLTAEGEDAAELRGREALDAEGRVSEHLQELRLALIVRGRVGAHHRVRLEERERRGVDDEGATHAAGLVLAGRRGAGRRGPAALVDGEAARLGAVGGVGAAEEAGGGEPVGQEADAEHAGCARSGVRGAQEAGRTGEVHLLHQGERALVLFGHGARGRGGRRLLLPRVAEVELTRIAGRAGLLHAGRGGRGARLRAGELRPEGAGGLRLAERARLGAGGLLRAGGQRLRAEGVRLGLLRGGRAGEREHAEERERGERSEPQTQRSGKDGFGRRVHRPSSARPLKVRGRSRNLARAFSITLSATRETPV